MPYHFAPARRMGDRSLHLSAVCRRSNFHPQRRERTHTQNGDTEREPHYSRLLNFPRREIGISEIFLLFFRFLIWILARSATEFAVRSPPCYDRALSLTGRAGRTMTLIHPQLAATLGSRLPLYQVGSTSVIHFGAKYRATSDCFLRSGLTFAVGYYARSGPACWRKLHCVDTS